MDREGLLTYSIRRIDYSNTLSMHFFFLTQEMYPHDMIVKIAYRSLTINYRYPFLDGRVARRSKGFVSANDF